MMYRKRDKRNVLLIAMLLTAVILFGLSGAGAPDAIAYSDAEWEQIGGGLDVSANDVYVDGEEIYAAYRDDGALYMKYFDGNEWTTLGGKLSSGNGYNPFIVVRNGVPYVSFRNDVSGAWGYISVRYYDWSADEWRFVGNHGFSNEGIVDSAIAFDDDGTLYAFYRKSDSGTPETKAFTEDEHGEWDWRPVGDMSGLPLSPSSSKRSDMNVDNGVVYVAYHETPATGFIYSTPVVVRYDTNDEHAEWEQLTGTSGSLGNHGRSSKVSISVYQGEPYIAYHGNAPTHRLFVKKYQDGEWLTIGQFASGYEPRLATAAGHIFMSSRLHETDYPPVNHRLVLRSYDGMNWNESSVLHASSTSAGIENRRLQYDQGRIYAGFNDGGFGRVYSMDTGVSAGELLAPPMLAAGEPLLASEALEILFQENSAWEEAITAVRFGNRWLTQGTQYTIAPGKITIMPDVLSAGMAELRVAADGYSVALLFQPIKPVTPGGLEVNRTGHRFAELGWQAVPEATSYKVYYREDAGEWEQMNVTGTSARVTGLTNDAPHTFFVVSVAGSIESSPSGEVIATPHYIAVEGKAWDKLGLSFDGLHPLMHGDGESLYIAYRNNGRPSVRSWDGSEWLQVGTPYLGNSSYNGFDVSVAASGGESAESKVYAGYISQGELHVRTYDAHSGEWQLIGDAVVTAEVSKLAPLVMDGEIPYVAYVGGDGRIHVKRFAAGNGEWVDAAEGAVFGNGTIVNLQLRAGEGAVYLAYVESTGSQHAMKLAKLDVGGGASAWENVDSSALPNVIHWGLGEFLAVEGDSAYVAYPAFSNPGIALWRLSADGEWSNLGGPVYSKDAYDVSIAIDRGAPLIAYADGQDNNYMVHVNKMVNGHWYPVGQSIAPEAGFAGNLNVQYINDAPYISFYNGVYAVEAHRFTYDWCETTLRYGNGAEDSVLNVPCFEPVPLQVDPARDGYLFAGWHIGLEKYDFLSPIDENTVLQAKWKLPSPNQFMVDSYGDGVVTLRWDAVEHASGYKVYVRTESASFDGEPVEVADTAYTFDTLTNGVRYFFTVAAIGGEVDSDAAPEVSETPRTAPGAPVITSAVAGNGQATIAFAAPESDGGAAIEKYVLAWQANGHEAIQEGDASPIIVTGLVNRETYTFTVTAVNSEGPGSSSAASEPVMPYNMCLMVLSAMDDTDMIIKNLICGDTVEEQLPSPREGYTFEGWYPDNHDDPWDFSVPVHDNTWLNGRWTFDPAAIPAGEWNIVHNKLDHAETAHIIVDDALYQAALQEGLLKVRKYVEREGWLAVGSPLAASDLSDLVRITVEGGSVYVLYMDEQQRLTLSSYDETNDSTDWSLVGAISDQPGYISNAQVVKQGSNLFISYTEGLAGGVSKVWKHVSEEGGLWLDISPALTGISGFKLLSYNNGLLALYSKASEIGLIYWSDTGSSADRWSDFIDLSGMPAPNIFGDLLLASDGESVYAGYLTSSFTYRFLRLAAGQAIDLGNPFEQYIAGLSLAVYDDEPYLFHSGEDAVGVMVFRDGAWRTIDSVVSAVGGAVARLSAGVGANTRYMHYTNINNEPVTRFYARPLCEVTFDHRGGIGAGKQTVRCGELLDEPETARAGFELDGWFKEPDGAAWSFDSDVVDSDTTLYAKWTRSNWEGPEPPAGLAAVAGDRQVTLSWSGAPDTVTYSVYMGTSSGTYDSTPEATVAGDVLQHIVDGLDNGTRYYFMVSATNIYGESKSSAETEATPATVPGAPTIIAAQATNSGRVTVSFIPPTDDGGNPVILYEVTASDGNSTVAAQGTSGTIEVSGLTNGAVYTFTVRARNEQGWGPASAPSEAVTPRAPQSGGNGVTGPSAEPDDKAAETEGQGFEVLVNERPIKAGSFIATETDGRTTAIIVLDADMLQEQINSQGSDVTVKLQVDQHADVVYSELTGDIVKSMELKRAVLDIETVDARYILPAKEINISELSAQFGEHVTLRDIKVGIQISLPTAEQIEALERAESQAQWSIAAAPVGFTVTAAFNDQTVEASKFNAYVERRIALPDDVQPGDVTTAVVVEQDGSIRHVPTSIVQIDGRYYAVIRSLTNSWYALVSHSSTFADLDGHWSRESVEDMSARMIVNGIGNNRFNPDDSVTRAEFAAMLMRGLGLPAEGQESPFPDVSGADWYFQAVAAAYEYGLIDGFADGFFRPDERITREQAMTIAARAMPLVGIKADVSQADGEILERYADRDDVSIWARQGAAASVSAGLVTGRAGDRLVPLANVTRAEAAVIIRMLLLQSGLIDN